LENTTKAMPWHDLIEFVAVAGTPKQLKLNG